MGGVGIGMLLLQDGKKFVEHLFPLKITARGDQIDR
jgi:hypothetical protein